MDANIWSYRRSLFQRIWVFPDDLWKKCKDNANEDQVIPIEVKDNITLMAMELGLYTQVVKLRRNDLKCFAENKNKNEAKFKFQGLSER